MTTCTATCASNWSEPPERRSGNGAVRGALALGHGSALASRRHVRRYRPHRVSDRPATPVMRFMCVSDLDEYREALQDPTCTVVHYFELVGAWTEDPLRHSSLLSAPSTTVRVRLAAGRGPTRRSSLFTSVLTIVVASGFQEDSKQLLRRLQPA